MAHCGIRPLGERRTPGMSPALEGMREESLLSKPDTTSAPCDPHPSQAMVRSAYWSVLAPAMALAG